MLSIRPRGISACFVSSFVDACAPPWAVGGDAAGFSLTPS